MWNRSISCGNFHGQFTCGHTGATEHTRIIKLKPSIRIYQNESNKTQSLFHIEDFESLLKEIAGVDDQNGKNRHQHLKIVTYTFRLQHPSATSM